MKVLALCLVFMIGVVSSEKDKVSAESGLSNKIGAGNSDPKKDDLPGTHDVKVAPHKSLKEIKKLAQDDRVQLKRMQARAKELKQEIANKMGSKPEMKVLKKEFKKLKKDLSSVKSDLSGLKVEMKEKKLAKKQGKQKKGAGGRGGARSNKVRENAPDDLLFMAEKEELSQLQSSTAKPATTTADLLRLTSKLERMKSRRRNKKKGNKKGKGKGDDFIEMIQSDQPILSRDIRMDAKGVSCNADSDCKESGATCVTNKRGQKHCKSPHGMDKSAGKKCHSSRQCAEGLQCFVMLTSEQQHHKKHPRRGKGTCADPETADTSKGKFLPKQ